MKHALLTAPRTIEWRERPAPPLGPGEILVGIRAALTCGTDLKTYRRGHPKLGFGPFGHEASGDVIAIGPGVDRFSPGDAVMWVQTAPCKSCAPCRSGFENLCERLFERIALGAYGDEIVLPAAIVERNVYRKPAHLSYVDAAFLEPFSCVVHGWSVLRRANAQRPMPADVAIVGAGTIGLLHVLFAVRAGVRATVIARPQRSQLARSLGAADIVDGADGERLAELRGAFEAVIECAGSADSWRDAVRLARPGGRVVLFSGLPSDTIVDLDATNLHYHELSLLGAFHFTPDDVREAHQLLGFGGIDVKPLVDGVEPLDRLEDVFERLDRREGHKYALIP